MGHVTFKDTGRRIIDGRRRQLMEYYARCPSGAYLHLNGQTETNESVWYWKGSWTQFYNMNSAYFNKHGQQLTAVHESELALAPPPPNEMP